MARKGGQPNRENEAALSAERLKELLDYDPETGIFTSKVNNTHWRIGKPVVGRKSWGYLSTKVDGRTYRQHRLAWLHVHGRWPEHFIDHINGDRSDNRIDNLRDVPAKVNARNRVRANRQSKTGFLGVHLRSEIPEGGRRFVAVVNVNGDHKTVGHFLSPEEAHAAYLKAKEEAEV